MACFEELVVRHEAPLLGYLRGRTGNRHDAEDIAQESFVAAFRRLGRFDPARRFAPWLYTIASRLAVDHARARRPTTPLDALNEPAAAPAAGAGQGRDAEQLWDMARRVLTDDQYAAIRLRYMDAMSVRETAAIMGKSAIHVKVLLHRGRRALAARLGRGLDGPSGARGGR